jgi:hypothetical protein
VIAHDGSESKKFSVKLFTRSTLSANWYTLLETAFARSGVPPMALGFSVAARRIALVSNAVAMGSVGYASTFATWSGRSHRRTSDDLQALMVSAGALQL